MALIEQERTEDPTPASSRHAERATAFFGTWAIIGLYLDGWAHIHDQPETFFSPWHGVLYSGVGVAVAYFAVREYVLRKPSGVEDRWLTAGFLVFAAGAVLDLAWHEVFGIEVDLEALLSPTHLLLLTGGCLMLSYPARSAAARPDGRSVTFGGFLPVIASLSLMALLIQFFTQYFAAHRIGGLWPTDALRPDGDDTFELFAIGAVFVTNLILMAVTFIAVRRWDTPIGTFATIYGALALGVTGMLEFEVWKHIPAAVAAGLITDLLARALRPSAIRRRQALAFGCLAPLFLWGLWLLAIQLSGGIRWSVDLWAGTLYLSVLEGLGLALLAFPREAAPQAT